MSDERRWQDAKIPQWVKDAVQADIDQWRLTAALAWPTEAKPAPLPFRWGEYDSLTGTPAPGRYWCVPVWSRIEVFDLERIENVIDETHTRIARREAYKGWAFRTNDKTPWHSSVTRGPLFASEADAKLYRRWLMCEDFAKQLMRAM
jgi:hypothetical protein